jgi:hypothetical protein
MYAITRGLNPAELAGVVGLDDSSVAIIEKRELQAIVSDVDLSEYGEEGLRKNLERLEWLEEVARRHDAVVHAVASHGPTAPMRLATICRGDAGVLARLDDWYHALQMVLDRVEGRTEWSVKAFTPAQPTAVDQDLVESERAVGVGAAYLQRKDQAARRRADTEARAIEVAAGLHSALSQLSFASRRLAPQDPRLTGHTGVMTLNGAYLVENDQAEAFASEVDRLKREYPESQIDSRGPWPPYSFAMLEQR